ncbi:MAG TPA: lysozyme inhibitor LprI family protein [Bradyrhizobium sp.]|uniref:lysozyme inhibitor LprI family protein n=1 Tax=Bradyrhizobium sp. TaxID=376 RepID=UPI002D809927|nr:lysozyme inhibitor LprI family protein [Bradyrhizobium sp.]HET7889775.1 lysozyme inhibitor LprI family protein [Bradyrhizobium sp.]
MRAFVLAIVMTGIGLAQPGRADNAADANRPMTDVLPLFVKNHCEAVKAPADQLFCADPELNAVGIKLNSAIAERLNRVPNRRLAIEENAEWIRDRNSSCGILGSQPIKRNDIKPVRDCLLKETAERIEILADPNFDCLAVNTTAGLLICSDPALALAKTELNEKVMATIAKLKDNEARDAFDEFERWTRERDRKCGLANKDNVPLRELSPSEGCLSDYFAGKAAEVVAAKGDPKKLFGRQQISAEPNADAVDLCIAQIHATGACTNFLAVNRILQTDARQSESTADVVSSIEMVVVSPFTACSPIASSCTGTCWDLKSARPKSTPGSREQLRVGYRLRIEKSFAFQKNGTGWRCNTTTMEPVESGVALSGP